MDKDFTFENHGSICVLTPVTESAKEWTEDHLPAEAMRWMGGVCIEPRYVDPILDGIAEAGLTVH